MNIGMRNEDGREEERNEDWEENRILGLGRREDRSEDRFGKEREEEKSIV